MTTSLDCSVSLKKETVYGTAVVVDHPLEFLSESFENKPGFLQGKGLRPGFRVPRSARRSIGKQEAGGSLTIEAPTKGLGILLEAAFGANTVTVVPSQAGVYQQVHTPILTDFLASYTIQKGIPKLGGAVDAITFLGAQCSSLEISAKVGEIVEVATDWTAREAKTSIAYASPSYPTPLDVFTFVDGVICVGSTLTVPTATALATANTPLANISEVSAKWDNNLDAGGWNIGGAGLRSRAAAVGLGALTGKLGATYDSAVLRDAYMAQTPLALLLTFADLSVIGTSAHPTLQLVVPCIKLEGELPKANGGDVVVQAIDFTGLDPEVSGQPAVYAVYLSTDTAI